MGAASRTGAPTTASPSEPSDFHVPQAPAVPTGVPDPAPDPLARASVPPPSPAPSGLIDGSPGAADDSLFRRPAPGMPDPVPLRPASEPAPVVPEAKDDGDSDLTDTAIRTGRAARGVQATSRARTDSTRRWTVIGISLVVLVGLVGGAGFLFSRYGSPTASSSAALTLPRRVTDFDRDPTQGASPSTHPDTGVQTVSASYQRGGVHQFIALASRPQGSPEEVLAQLKATNVVTHPNGLCGQVGTPPRTACVVVRRDTAVMVITLVDQPAGDLLTLASLIADGLGSG